MHFSSCSDNKLKNGRVWFYLNESYSKNIGIEWSLRFNPFNFYLEMDGGERDYTLCFWFIFVFYIKFSGIFKYYPKEWNSCTNNNQGGYIESATRKIGISQYDLSMNIYLWHDGENSWYPDKDDKIWYKWIDFESILKGSWIYHTIEERDYTDSIELLEGMCDVDVQYRYWDLRYDRFYMKLFNKKGKSILIKSNIKYPYRKWCEDDDISPEDLERTMSDRGIWYSLKSHETVQISLDQYKDEIIKLRSCEIDWVPFEFRKIINRKKILNDLLI